MSAPAIEQFDAKTEQRKAELQEQLRAAERPYRRAGRWLSAGVVVLALLAAGLMSPIGGFAGQASAAVPIGLAAALVPGLLMAAAAWALLRTGWTTVTELDPGVWGAGLAAGCAVMAVPLLPGPARRLAPAEADGAADSMGQQLRAAGAVNALAVLTALAVGAFFVRDGQVPSAVQTAAVAAPVALLIGLVMRAGMPERAGRGVERWARPVLLLLFGLAGLRTDLTGGIDWLLIVLVLLGFGDGKSAGLMLGIRMFAHRPWLEALRMGTVSATGGAAPLAVALLLRGAGVIDNPAYVALVAASVLSAWLAEPMLRALDHTVEQMNQPPDDAQ